MFVTKIKGKLMLPGLAVFFFLMAGGAGDPFPAGEAGTHVVEPPARGALMESFPVIEEEISRYPFPGFPYPAVPAPSLLPDTDPLVIPLKRAGRLYLIEAVIDGVSGNLVFDTGARDLLLNRTYFRKHVTSGSVSSKGITGDVGSVELITAGKVEFAGMVFDKLTAEVTDLAHIENRRGVKILGLVGFSLLKKFEILFDPVNGQLTLFRTDAAGRRNNGVIPPFKADHLQKLTGNGHVVFLKGSIAGRSLNFCFDTAAETNVISSASHKTVLATIAVTRRASLKGAGTGASEVLFGKMNDFSLGTRKIDNMETVVTSLFALEEVYHTSLDGVLGFSFFRNGEICVNFVTKEAGFRFVKGGEE